MKYAIPSALCVVVFAVSHVSAASWCLRVSCVTDKTAASTPACIISCGTDTIDLPVSDGEIARACAISNAGVYCAGVPTASSVPSTTFPTGVTSLQSSAEPTVNTTPLTGSGVYGGLFSIGTLSVPVTAQARVDAPIVSTIPLRTYTSFSPSTTTAVVEPVPVPTSQNASPQINVQAVPIPVTPTSLVTPESVLADMQSTQPQDTSLLDAVRTLLGASVVPGMLDRALTYGQPVRGTQSDAPLAPAPRTTGCVGTSGVQTFTKNLVVGDVSSEVVRLQQFLNATPATRIAQSGAGSPGQETERFGVLTLEAVKKFQALYVQEILVPLGYAEPTGLWGVATRAKANALACGRP